MKKCTLIVFMVSAILSGCLPQTTEPIQINEIVSPYSDTRMTQNGEKIEILAPEGWNTYKIGDPISLMVRNVSNEKIKFSHDFSARIFAVQDGVWQELNNKTVYPNNNTMVLDPDQNFDPFKIETLIVLPDFSDFSANVHLRIFVKGNILSNNQGNMEEIATYIDLQFAE